MADAIDSNISSSGAAEHHREKNEPAISQVPIGEIQEHLSEFTSEIGDHDHHELETELAEGERQ